MNNRIISANAAVLCFICCIGGQILPAERSITWTPGLGGPFPYGDAVENVTDHGAEGDRTTDDHAAFESAIDALPEEGGIVLIPEGTYLLSGTVSIGSSVMLRGEGSGKTKLHFDLGGSSSACIEFITYQRGEWVNVLSGFEKGSTILVVDDASAFAPDQYIEIQQDNDPAIMYTSDTWDVSWAENSVGQVLRTTGISGDTLFLDKALYIEYRADLNPVVRPQGFVEYGGVEKLYIKKVDDVSDGATIVLKNAAFCLIREIESDFTSTSHVSANTAYRCEVRDSYFHHSYDYGGGGHGYGTNFGLHTTDCLVENNVFVHLRHSMLVQVGACGNVFGYNYSIDDIQENETENAMTGLPLCDISLHGHYGNYNLFESNIVEEIDVSDYWGPVGPGNTFLRNITLSEGIDIKDNSHGQNLVANVLGTGNNVLAVADGVEGTLVHGNEINGQIKLDQSLEGETIPVSFYLEEAPWFFEDITWPAIGPEFSAPPTIPAKKTVR